MAERDAGNLGHKTLREIRIRAGKRAPSSSLIRALAEQGRSGFRSDCSPNCGATIAPRQANRIPAHMLFAVHADGGARSMARDSRLQGCLCRASFPGSLNVWFIGRRVQPSWLRMGAAAQIQAGPRAHGNAGNFPACFLPPCPPPTTPRM